MKLEKLLPDMVVYDVGRSKMGNTTLSTVSVWQVKIISVDRDKRTVVARWNNNPERMYYEGTWSKWKEKKPILVRTAMGSYRKATKDEIKSMEATK